MKSSNSYTKIICISLRSLEKLMPAIPFELFQTVEDEIKRKKRKATAIAPSRKIKHFFLAFHIPLFGASACLLISVCYRFFSHLKFFCFAFDSRYNKEKFSIVTIIFYVQTQSSIGMHCNFVAICGTVALTSSHKIMLFFYFN